MADDETRREINRLYWGSDASVGEIADRLGVSRRALYDNIEPAPADASCPDCGGKLGYRNRTAAEKREASCPDCGHERRLTADTATTVAERPAEDDVGAAGVPEDPEIERQERGAVLSPMPPRSLPTMANGPVLGGAILAGLAVGAALTLLARRS